MTTRQYSSRSQQTTLTGAITSGATSMTVVSGTALLGGVTIPAGRTFTLVIDVDTALEEIVDATIVSTNTFTITRAIDGSTAQEHSAGAVVRHMAIGRDYRDANLHAEADASYNDGGGNAHSMHGIAAGEGVVVGTLKTQTLTNKTLTSPTISNPTITGTSGVETSIVFEGSTADAYETTLTVVDPTQDNTITLPNTSGTVTINDATQTLSNKTLTSPVISGSPVITGLSSAGMVSSSATPKDYVDSILGSATAAATSAASAATSAASAAASASSAATSASNALTSANSASTSATAAATSAASAATSATAASTSATSAAASATSAANSASAAATSATSAANSATSSASSASAAATSATSASASATASATSASAAATSATSAAASATAAATSATSAAASATAAATSATSAAASATSAANSASAAATSATSAAASATAASTSETNAAASATAAATSASSASTSASSALTSANSASTSAASAATSASSAAASFDSFDDRYLGPKASAPTVDNDGNPLTSGVLYYNTTSGVMFVYNGNTSAWEQVAVSTSGFPTLAGNNDFTGLNTFTNAGTADVLRITNTGTGNTLIVEDSTNPDASPFVIDADGRTLIGHTTAGTVVVNAGLQVSGTGGTSYISQTRFSADANGPGLLFSKSRGSSYSVRGAVTSADTLGQLSFIGDDGTSYVQGANVFGYVDGTVSTGVVPGRLVFSTASSAGTMTERMRITSAGLLGIGGTPSGAMVQIFNNTAANVGLIVRGAASQTGDLLQIQNSAGTVLSRFTSAGWMGIGISPSYPLQVSATSVGSTVWVNVNNTDTTAGSAAGYFASNGAVNNVLYSSSNGGGGTLGTTTNHPLFIITNNAERMRIDASGNVGIGGVPSALLHINNASGKIRIGQDTSSSYLDIYRDSPTGGIIYNAAQASPYGFHVWQTAGTERMRIDASGNTTINAIADATTTTAARGGGYMGIPASAAATTGAYTIVAADAGEHIYSTATRTVTIPANSSVAFPVGTVLTFISGVGATTTIAITTDTMYLAGTGTTGSRTLAAHGMATAVKVASTTWYISGNGLT